MFLPAMVNLVLEEMHEQAVAAFGLNPRVAIDPHGAAEEGRRQRVADSDQAVVDCSLGGSEFGQRATRNLVLPGFWPEPSALERVDVKEIDDVDVVQGQLQAGEEARPLRLKFLLAQPSASRQQPVVRPGIIVGECAVGLNKAGGHLCSVLIVMAGGRSSAFPRYHMAFRRSLVITLRRPPQCGWPSPESREGPPSGGSQRQRFGAAPSSSGSRTKRCTIPSPPYSMASCASACAGWACPFCAVTWRFGCCIRSTMPVRWNGRWRKVSLPNTFVRNSAVRMISCAVPSAMP